ncbi:hypothetical protein, partial [Aeromonas rivipollensis]|uniref:hypothetical protein n=1 Tax=Aeromonas rivipollensis TaxID=948519 RepID=UPI003D1B2F93
LLSAFCFLLSAFCFLLSAFCFLLSASASASVFVVGGPQSPWERGAYVLGNGISADPLVRFKERFSS